MVRHLFLGFVLLLAPRSAIATSTLTLSNDRLEISIDLSVKSGHCTIHDLKTDETYAAPDFGVIRVWDNTEDRMRVLVLSPETTTSTCHIVIEQKSPLLAVMHVDTGPGSTSAMGTASFGVAFDIELKLQGDTFEYAIPIKTLREQQLPEGYPQRWRLMNVELFPMLGATPAGSPGYLLIPSWSGAVYYFDRNNARANPAFAKAGYGDLGAEAGLRSRWAFDSEAPG